MLLAVFFSMLLVSVSGCDSNDYGQLIEKNQLQNELKVGQALRLNRLLKTSDGVICILYPYQEYVAQKAPQSARINAYLKASGYVADESHWAFVVVESEKVHLSKFKRSGKLDAVSYAIQPEHKAKLPPGFAPVNCASLAHAVLTKIESHNQIFLIMGEMK